MSPVHIIVVLCLSSAASPAAAAFEKVALPRKLVGPEAFAFDAAGEGPYTSTSGGKILKHESRPDAGGGFVYFAHTSKLGNQSLCDGLPGRALFAVCGRPAGIGFNLKTGELYIADAVLGLYVAPPQGDQSVLLATEAEGKPFKFLDGLDVDPTTGAVYFTSFSSVFSAIEVLLAVAAKDSTGRLFKYDPSTKKVTVLLKGLSGSAGCAVSSDGSFVLVSEFIKSKITRYWISGPKAGTAELFAEVSNPDNIKRTDSDDFWVASVTNKFVLPTDPKAVKVNGSGAVLEEIPLKEHYGNTLVSEVYEYGGVKYVGTLTTPFMGVLKG